LFAIHCVRKGWDIRRLQQVLEHSGLNVMALYPQFNDWDIKEPYDKTLFYDASGYCSQKRGAKA
jgi:site-specific recombinase XerD